MKTCLYVNDYPLGEFSDVEIKESHLILKDAQIQNYKLMSWLQSDPNKSHDLDLDIERTFGTDSLYVTGSKIKKVVLDHNIVKKIVIDFNNIIDLNKPA